MSKKQKTFISKVLNDKLNSKKFLIEPREGIILTSEKPETKQYGLCTFIIQINIIKLISNNAASFLKSSASKGIIHPLYTRGSKVAHLTKKKIKEYMT